jgi:putative hydrolase of the HAD superfamily
MTLNYTSMEIDLSTRTVLAFDLDDTLYKEIEFVRSGFAAILSAVAPAESLEQELALMLKHRADSINPLDNLFNRYPDRISVAEMVTIYREHLPRLTLSDSLRELISNARAIGGRTAIITDGRSRTQRNKIKALGLEQLVDAMVISEEVGSEKPAKQNFQLVEEAFGTGDYFYFADNPRKDFLTPNQLGWTTVGLLDDGNNIHPQSLAVSNEYLPHYWISDWSDLCVSMGHGLQD